MAPLRQEDYMYDDFLNEPAAQPKKEENKKSKLLRRKKIKLKKRFF